MFDKQETLTLDLHEQWVWDELLPDVPLTTGSPGIVFAPQTHLSQTRSVWSDVRENNEKMRELFTEPDLVSLCSDQYLGHNPVGYVCLNSCYMTLWVIDCDKNIFSVFSVFLKLVLVDHWSRGGLHGGVERAAVCYSRILHKKQNVHQDTWGTSNTTQLHNIFTEPKNKIKNQ